ncbi:MAG: hypothetical protein AAF653_04880 [Chloroflexota bacterium]
MSEFYRDASRGRGGYMQRCKSCLRLIDKYKLAQRWAGVVGAFDDVTFPECQPARLLWLRCR